MNKLEYKQSVSDIKAIINDRDRFKSKFGRFYIREGLEGIWNCKTRNCIAVINRDKKFIRIRGKSVYFPALSALEGWTVVPSKTLGRYRDRGLSQIHTEIYLNYFIRPQVEAINAEKPDKLVIDLGPDESVYHNARNMFNSVKDSELRGHIFKAFKEKIDRTYEIDLKPVVNSTEETDRPQPRPTGDENYFFAINDNLFSSQQYNRVTTSGWQTFTYNRAMTLDETEACEPDENDVQF